MQWNLAVCPLALLILVGWVRMAGESVGLLVVTGSSEVKDYKDGKYLTYEIKNTSLLTDKST